MSRDILCEEADATAPRVGCRCRGCCMTRERHVDPRLAALAYGPNPVMATQLSAALIHRQIQRYIVGDIALEALSVEIIKALAEVVGKQQEQLSMLISTRPVFVATPPEDAQPDAILPPRPYLEVEAMKERGFLRFDAFAGKPAGLQPLGNKVPEKVCEKLVP